MEQQLVDQILAAHEHLPHRLVEILQDVQEAEGYLSAEAMKAIAERLEIPQIEVYRVANYYTAFTLSPRGQHVITVCAGTACHVRGAPRMLEEVTTHLDIQVGETTPDGLFTVERVNCLGACALGPVVVLDGVYHDHMTPGKLRKLVGNLRDSAKEVAADA